MSDSLSPPAILWDSGTAYDLFASLEVLHNPSAYGLRGAWAAGVRSRLEKEDREFFEDLMPVFSVPLHWVHELPAPKDATTALFTLKQTPREKRLGSLLHRISDPPPHYARYYDILERGSWDAGDSKFVLNYLRERAKDNDFDDPPSQRQVEKYLEYIANPAEFGEIFYRALQSYYDVFFAEEEKRIAPKLDEALARAQDYASQRTPDELFEHLARGVKYGTLSPGYEFVFVPSFWFSPLLIGSLVAPNRKLMLYGGRQPGESLVPGEIVSEDLTQALKALAEPTRLRILRYLMQEQLTPAELSRRLRLRAPTVTHHLHTLRLAGLVQFAYHGKNERLYFARMESIQQAYAMLKEFLEQDVDEAEAAADILDRNRVF